jgi:hypothetical protein
MKVIPQTTRARTSLKNGFELGAELEEELKGMPSTQTPSSRSSANREYTMEYLVNRDPMKEFF